MPFRAEMADCLCVAVCSATTVAYDNASRLCKFKFTLSASYRIDAYKDPLGTTAPRIKAQVKYHDQKIGPRMWENWRSRSEGRGHRADRVLGR
jgi:hypothetical protein